MQQKSNCLETVRSWISQWSVIVAVAITAALVFVEKCALTFFECQNLHFPHGTRSTCLHCEWLMTFACDNVLRCDCCFRNEGARNELRTCVVVGCSATFCSKCAGNDWHCSVCDMENEPLPPSFKENPRDEAKARCNQTFVRAATVSNAQRVLLLDGPKGVTSRLLANKGAGGLTARDIVTPNACERDAKKLARLGVSTVHRMRFGTYLRKTARRSQRGFDAIFYDACGSWAGSKKMGLNPREDVRRIFGYGLRRAGRRPGMQTVLACTFNNSRRSRSASFHVGDPQAEISAEAEKHGWLVRKVQRIFYGNMRFWCFHLVFVC